MLVDALVGHEIDQLIQLRVGIGGQLSDMEHMCVKGGDWVIDGELGVVGGGAKLGFGSHENG